MRTAESTEPGNRFPTLALILLLAIAWCPGLQAGSRRDITAEQLRLILESSGVPPHILVDGTLIYSSATLSNFYERRIYQPAWSDDRGVLPVASDLVSAIGSADREGLRPDDYHLKAIESMVRNIEHVRKRGKPLDPVALAELDLLLTDAYLVYASHLLSGRVDPETIDPEWRANRRDVDLTRLLETSLRSGAIEESLMNLVPPQQGYARLRQRLALLRGIADKGGWPPVPAGPKMRKGDRSDRVPSLRKRLERESDIEHPGDDESDMFDDELDMAVRHFQERHGLEVDGIVGPATLEALNVPAEARIRQIEINMERWRWLPQELGKRYILVNIANFTLEVVEEGNTVLTMRVIVGRQYRRTPVFSDRMTYLVLCPYWVVPSYLAVEDILPQLREDPDYVTRQRMKVFRGSGPEAEEIEPDSVDWSRVNPKKLPYRFRQDPGPNNALGRVKFMFPNKFNVYLHDTPSRDLFSKTVRTFSSGCIRIEKPIELAEYLLRTNPVWTREHLLSEIGKWTPETVPIPEPIPIHLLYWTAWAEEDGSIQFRDDVYGRDRLLYEALRETPPAE